MKIMFQAVGSKLQFEHVELTQDYPRFAGLIMSALIIWMLSHVL